ncbi:MAG: CocE/NonD family hydrolase, partial [SAR202 cluster bacterium]|nr:CocE/NonD family hydrolase [SAR202 cluster bacterium]
DVHPRGMAIIICEGIARARFRDSLTAPSLIEPGTAYEFHIDLWETSNVFKAGHQIRLEVSSSNFPRFDRNLNAGHLPGMDAEMRVADQTVYHDARRPCGPPTSTCRSFRGASSG